MVMMLKVKALILGAAFLTVAVAAPADPIEKQSPGVCKPVGNLRTLVATYDDLKFVDPPVKPIGTYKELAYNNFYVDNDDGFIPASSGLQYAMSFDCTKRRLITVDQKGDSFNLISFNYACNQGYPQNECFLGITGTYVDGKTISQPLYYPALDSSRPFYSIKVFPNGNWKDLKSLEITGGTIDGTCIYTGVFIDDLTYEKKRCK